MLYKRILGIPADDGDLSLLLQLAHLRHDTQLELLLLAQANMPRKSPFQIELMTQERTELEVTRRPILSPTLGGFDRTAPQGL